MWINHEVAFTVKFVENIACVLLVTTLESVFVCLTCLQQKFMIFEKHGYKYSSLFAVFTMCALVLPMVFFQRKS